MGSLPFIGLAVFAVGAFVGVLIGALVRRLVGDRNAFQMRLQSEQLQKQTREMREQAARLEELETERMRLEADSEGQERSHQEQIEQLSQIRSQIGEKLDLMSKQTTSEAPAMLAQLADQLVKERERTDQIEQADHSRSDAAISTLVEQLTQLRSHIGEKLDLVTKQAAAEGQAMLARAEQLFAARAQSDQVEHADHSQSDATIHDLMDQLTQFRSQIGEKLDLVTKQAATEGQAMLARAEQLFSERAQSDRTEHADHSQSDATINALIDQLTQFRSQIGEKLDVVTKQAATEGQAMLARAEQLFSERAQAENLERIDHSQSDATIRSLIQPITETLARFDQKLAAIEDNRRQSLGAIVETLEQVARVHVDVRDETRRLADALENSPTAIGGWSEQQLKNVLELAGMTPYVDIVPSDPARAVDGLQPDAVLRLPGNRRLVIDANLPTQPYMAAVGAKDRKAGDRAQAEHAALVRKHLERLGSAEYREGFDIRPELAVMFLPAENMLASALAKDPALFEDGVKRQVLMATPTTLVALAKSVAHSWEQEKSLENVRELAVIGAELLDRMAQVGDQVDELGRGLEASVRSYNSFVGDLQGSVMTQLRRLRELNPLAGKREMREPQQVELSVRAPRRRRNFVITQAGQEAAAAITVGPEGPPIPAPARAMAPAATSVPSAPPKAPEPPRPSVAPIDPF